MVHRVILTIMLSMEMIIYWVIFVWCSPSEHLKIALCVICTFANIQYENKTISNNWFVQTICKFENNPLHGICSFEFFFN